MRQMNRQVRFAITAVVVVSGLLGAAQASAQSDRRGVYAGIDLGFAHAAPLDSSVSAVTTPTKCDTLLYPDPAMAPRDAPQCTDTTPRALSSTGFAPGAGFAGGFSAGYNLDTLRVEFEYRVRAHGDDVSSILESSTNDAVVSKALEWSPVYPPTEAVSDYRVQQFFANVYYDLANASRWTP